MSLADEIKQMSADNPEWDAGKLAEHFKCRREYVRTAAKRLGFKVKVFRCSSWTAEEDAKLLLLREQKMRWGDIAHEFDRPRSSCAGRYADLTDPPVCTNLVADRTIVPAERFIDRDRRINCAPRDLTASMFGDPKPGFSALERRA
ncbi:hypothetical protein [Tardiphaga sp. 841_E9_N1_2]|uniref:hypothetical protein n=1 Tax=Tardiphaga sp. 841_E9_N1_2 TaxID=3240762 RepID=UPI003F247635